MFGAPERLDDHADRAVAAAREIAERLREKVRERTKKVRTRTIIRFGIGINSGPVVVGSVGGGGRLEFAVIGDPVNVAARVEHLTRETGDTILISEAARGLLRRPDLELEPRGEFALKGVSEPVPIYAVPTPLDGNSNRAKKTAQARA